MGIVRLYISELKDLMGRPQLPFIPSASLHLACLPQQLNLCDTHTHTKRVNLISSIQCTDDP